MYIYIYIYICNCDYTYIYIYIYIITLYLQPARLFQARVAIRRRLRVRRGESARPASLAGCRSFEFELSTRLRRLRRLRRRRRRCNDSLLIVMCCDVMHRDAVLRHQILIHPVLILVLPFVYVAWDHATPYSAMRCAARRGNSKV